MQLVLLDGKCPEEYEENRCFTRIMKESSKKGINNERDDNQGGGGKILVVFVPL